MAPGFTAPTVSSNRKRRIAFGIVATLALALLILWLVFDWNWFKRPIEDQVQARTGREFHIDGDLHVDIGRIVTISADRLRFANATWSKQPQMASADRVEIELALWPLLWKRELRIPAIRLQRPQLLLETWEKSGNWNFGDGGGGTLPHFGQLWVKDGHVQFVDAPGRTDIGISVNSVALQHGDAQPPIEVTGKGRWEGNLFTLKGRTESPLDLLENEQPYRINLHASAGPTHAHASGNLISPLQLRDFDLQFALSGRDMEDLYPLIGIAIPPTPPYRLDGRLRRQDSQWTYQDFKGRVGDSDLAGTARINVGGERPFLRAELVSKRLDLDDLAGFIGAPPKSGKGETSNTGQKAQSAKLAASSKILPDTPYNLEKLHAMDADVRLKAHRINAPGLPIDDMDAHLQLQAGLLRLDPLNFGVANGDIRSIIRMDARSNSNIRTQAQIAVRGLDLGRLLPDVKLTQDAIGKIGGQVALDGRGNSIAQMLGSANGSVALGMGRGQISNLIMEMAGLDIAESLKFLLTKDHKVPIRCAFGDFTVRDGVMDSRALAFDTTDTIIIGNGKINLRDETLDLLLRPRPKDRSILALRSPLHVGGSFKDPSFRPDFKALGVRGAIALALGSIAPPAALLATIETGPGKDSDCGGHYAK